MADNTSIEWARHPLTGKGATWNILTGCQIVSPGCTNCYAMKLAGSRLQHHESRKGLTKQSKAGPVWTGEVRYNEQWLTQPLNWRTPRGIFVAAHGDLFADGVTDAQLDQIFAVMALCPQHIFFVLTKRPERMRAYLTRPAGNGQQDVRNHLAWEVLPQVMNAWAPGWKSEGIDGPHRSRGIHAFTEWPLPNVWLGVSVEDQARANERINVLVKTPAAIRFISFEPLLGHLNLSRWMGTQGGAIYDGGGLMDYIEPEDSAIDWVITGGESGPSARPSHPDWFRSLRDQCAASGTPFFFKQWGEWIDWREVASGFRNCSRFDRLGNVTAARARMHPPYKNGFVQPEGDFPWLGNMIRVGKRHTGHTLDGIEHLAFPALSSSPQRGFEATGAAGQIANSDLSREGLRATPPEGDSKASSGAANAT